MGLTELRRWHWIVIGALLGLIIGYSLNAIGTDALVVPSTSIKTSQETFESQLTADPKPLPDGNTYAWIRKITVYPDGPIDLLKLEQFKNLDPERGDNSVKWGYVQSFFEASRPYSPLINPRLRTEVLVKPDFPPEGYFADNDWREAEGGGQMWRDPGSGARLFLTIAPGNYDIVFHLDGAQQAADLTVKFNGHQLAPLAADPHDPHFFRTTIPASDFDSQQARELWLGRGEIPVHIHQIHIYNPTYTVRTFLDSLKAQKKANGSPQYPNAQYSFAWWVEPRAILWLSLGISVLVIGIIWPTVLNLLTGAGFGPPPREKKGVSLRNLKATPVPVAGVRGPDAEDLAALGQMEESLLEDLESSPQPTSGGSGGSGGPAPVRQLNAKTVDQPLPPPPKKEEGPKSFAGEYYPVARKATSDDKKDDKE